MTSTGHRFVPSRDGVSLAYRELGAGDTVVLFHGRMDRGAEFVESGLADHLVNRGFRVILADLRGHGASAKPHDPALWPSDVHTTDGLDLIDHLGLVDYDLLGHSLGARTVVRMLIRGARPRRAILSGQSLDALRHATEPERLAWYHDFFAACGAVAFAPGSDEQETEEFIRRTGADPAALLSSLHSYVDTSIAELSQVAVPTLVLTGADEVHNRTAPGLAAALGNGRHLTVPGDHFTAKASPEFAEAVDRFLAEDVGRPPPAPRPPRGGVTSLNAPPATCG